MKMENLVQRANALPKSKRQEILTSFEEIEMHKHLKELFQALEPSYVVEITHGPGEFGKDLVMVKDDVWGRSVIGFVVHKGDIKAKTLGDVDKILSQVKQAFSHPVKIKTIAKKLQVDEVRIVLIGEFSQNAIERLEKENENRNVKYLDINWLIDNFTEYYPYVFFKGRMIGFIEKKIEEFEICHLFAKRGQNLSECFVDPLVTNLATPLKLDEKSMQNIIKSRRVPFSKFESVLSHNRKTILTGEPGTGKTLILNKIMIDKLKSASSLLFKGDIKEKIEIPILVHARDLFEIDNSIELLKHYFPDEELINKFKVILLMIDGLDETIPKKRKQILNKASKISDELNCYLLIASRKIDFLQTAPSDYKIYELLPFEFGQALKLFSKLKLDQNLLNSLKEGLKKFQYQVPMTPLSLMLLIELVESYKEIPASITELYERFTEIILGRYDKEKGIEVLFDYVIKKRFLSEFTYEEFFQKERLEVPLNSFNGFLIKYSKRYRWRKSQLRDFLREIDRAGIIEIKDKIIFLHRSFLDYFIAYYIFQNRERIKDLNNKIAKLHFSGIWEDVAFFYIGLKREINDEILDEIFANEEDEFSVYINKFLVGKLLQAGWHSTTNTKQNGMKRALEQFPYIRKKFLEIAETVKARVPHIIIDLLIIVLTEFSFSSAFLLKESKVIFNYYAKKQKKLSPFMMLLLLQANIRLYKSEEVQKMVDKIIKVSEKISSLEERGRILIFLTSITEHDKALTKSIERKLKKMIKHHPKAFKGILPEKRKGFR
ncbi:MAG: NACHT domain-containing protein [Candidatus Hodarchaeota archaeon]